MSQAKKGIRSDSPDTPSKAKPRDDSPPPTVKSPKKPASARDDSPPPTMKAPKSASDVKSMLSEMHEDKVKKKKQVQAFARDETDAGSSSLGKSKLGAAAGAKASKGLASFRKAPKAVPADGGDVEGDYHEDAHSDHDEHVDLPHRSAAKKQAHRHHHSKLHSGGMHHPLFSHRHNMTKQEEHNLETLGMVRMFSVDPEMPKWPEQHEGSWQMQEAYKKKAEWARLVAEVRTENSLLKSREVKGGSGPSQGVASPTRGHRGLPSATFLSAPKKDCRPPLQGRGQGPLPLQDLPQNVFKEVRRDEYPGNPYNMGKLAVPVYQPSMFSGHMGAGDDTWGVQRSAIHGRAVPHPSTIEHVSSRNPGHRPPIVPPLHLNPPDSPASITRAHPPHLAHEPPHHAHHPPHHHPHQHAPGEDHWNPSTKTVHSGHAVQSESVPVPAPPATPNESGTGEEIGSESWLDDDVLKSSARLTKDMSMFGGGGTPATRTPPSAQRSLHGSPDYTPPHGSPESVTRSPLADPISFENARRNSLALMGIGPGGPAKNGGPRMGPPQRPSNAGYMSSPDLHRGSRLPSPGGASMSPQSLKQASPGGASMSPQSLRQDARRGSRLR